MELLAHEQPDKQHRELLVADRSADHSAEYLGDLGIGELVAGDLNGLTDELARLFKCCCSEGVIPKVGLLDEARAS
jgi:hypothetical protein